ncbi:MAG TPA: hypothetical protein VNR17_01670, partial [Luteimicrobium sp.]|nr:hypothetical protein [Luteimicrobium sp.]
MPSHSRRCSRRKPRTAAAGAAASSAGSGFDVVFLDPPYDLAEDAVATVLAHLAAPGVLAAGAV